LVKLFQRRLKYEKVNGQTTNAKWWQYPKGLWAKKMIQNVNTFCLLFQKL
jgi:hypothetical protein